MRPASPSVTGLRAFFALHRGRRPQGKWSCEGTGLGPGKHGLLDRCCLANPVCPIPGWWFQTCFKHVLLSIIYDIYGISNMFYFIVHNTNDIYGHYMGCHPSH